jgi:hypothetical protein
MEAEAQEPQRREPKYPEITLGEMVCEKLKAIYHTDDPWQKCYMQVAQRFTDLKRIARKFYCDKDELEMLQELVRYSEKDIQEMIHVEH